MTSQEKLSRVIGKAIAHPAQLDRLANMLGANGRVSIRHWRAHWDDGYLFREGSKIPNRNAGPRGGITEVELRAGSGELVIGKAVCAKEDNYEHRVGVEIALRRAMKKMARGEFIKEATK